MAEEAPVSPIAAAEPPKVNPLGGAVPGSTQTALKPGLKLPPKPGATMSALRPGLKLPPKPGATATSALKPGLKLPTRPMIRKPGATVAVKPLPKPITGAPVPPPVAGQQPSASAPSNAAAVPVDAQGVGKLPTVAAQAISRNDPKPVVSENPKPMEALKTVTQKLKGITQQIPQQAILRKTGIIAEDAMTDAQKQAAKSKTARIALSDAMGVAPVKNENAPMKTIRIKRPVDIPASTNTKLSPVPPPAESAASAEGEGDADTKEMTITQRKTLKISRPGSGAVRPTGKFGIKRPVSQATTVAKSSPAAGESAAAPASAEGGVADIPDIPTIPDMPVSAAQPTSDGPAWLWSLSALVQIAACVAIGALAWFLYQNTQTQYF